MNTELLQSQPNQPGMWAIIELMGHRKLKGYITEVMIAGSAMVRIGLYNPNGVEVNYQVYSSQSIYCITPTTRNVCIEQGQYYFTSWETEESLSAKLLVPGEESKSQVSNTLLSTETQNLGGLDTYVESAVRALACILNHPEYKKMVANGYYSDVKIVDVLRAVENLQVILEDNGREDHPETAGEIMADPDFNDQFLDEEEGEPYIKNDLE
jgi:hypothetical protein